MKKKNFIIFADSPPPLEKYDLLRYKNDVGFDTYIMTEDHIKFSDSQEKFSLALKMLEECGLKVFIRGIDDNRFPKYFEQFKNFNFNHFSAVSGFYMTDEPGTNKFSEIEQNYVKYFNQQYNSKHFHINLLPSYATEEQLGVKLNNKELSYERYIELYMSEVLSKVNGSKNVGLDHYPFRCYHGQNEMTENWLYDLYVVSSAAKRYKVDFSVCIQCFDDGDAWRKLTTNGEILFQIYTSLAFGANIFEYFIYQSLSFWEGSFTGMIKDGKETKYFEYAKESILILRSIENSYFQFNWQGVAVVRGAEKTPQNDIIFQKIKDKVIKEFKEFSITAEHDLLIGYFNHIKKNDCTAIMIVNFSDPVLNNVNTVQIEFVKGYDIEIFLDGQNQKLPLENEQIKFTLQAGYGTFIKMKKRLQ